MNARRIPEQFEVCLMGYRAVDVSPIRAKATEYLLALKDNQPSLAGEVQCFESAP